MPDASPLTLAVLQKAVTDGAAALRLTLKLEAVSPKVFPPTYEGGKYATEDRRIGGQTVPCVILDSVPSQANRMELALQEAVDGGEIELPVTVCDFSLSEAAAADPRLKRFRISSLQAPHRIADAILRDSSVVAEGKKPVKFKDTPIGKALDDEVDLGYATPLLKYAPHCLVWGMWHSTGDKRRAAGVKIARAMVSELYGVGAVPGVTTSSRLDPLGIQRLVDKEDEKGGVTIYKAKGGGWTLSKSEAEQKDNKPVLYGKKGKPSEINHGNVTPDLAVRRDKRNNPILGEYAGRPHPQLTREESQRIHKGGFTIEFAEQTTVLSLPALRRLRFPVASGERSKPDTDGAARVYLVALGLLGSALAVEAGYDLRSRCVLRAPQTARWEVLGRPGDPTQLYDLTKKDALNLYHEALAAVRAAGLTIHTDEVNMCPSADLVTLVKKSMDLAAAEAGEGGE